MGFCIGAPTFGPRPAHRPTSPTRLSFDGWLSSRARASVPPGVVRLQAADSPGQPFCGERRSCYMVDLFQFEAVPQRPLRPLSTPHPSPPFSPHGRRPSDPDSVDAPLRFRKSIDPESLSPEIFMKSLSLFTRWQIGFPTSFRRKPESGRFLKRFPDPPQASAGGDEIKSWVKNHTR